MSIEETASDMRSVRTVFKRRLTAFRKFLDECNERSDRNTIKTKLDRTSEMFAKYSAVHLRLECLDEATDYSVEHNILEDEFDLQASRAQRLLNPATINAVPSEAANSHRATSVTGSEGDRDVELPRVNLPTFSGQYEDWPGFAEQFKSAVHENSTISESKKLTYLRSCLTGDAAKQLEAFGNSAKDYTIAWDLLEKKYDEPSIIVDNHIGAIIDICLTEGRARPELHKFLSQTEYHYRALEKLGHLNTDTIWLFILTSNLDEATVTRWKEAKGNDFPKVDDFFEFMRERVKILTPTASETAKKLRNQGRTYTKPSRQTAHPREQPRNAYATQIKLYCHLCHKDHATQNCEQLKLAKPRDRTDIVKKAKLCINCLRSGHMINECHATFCKRCHRRHHTMLHWEFDTKGHSSQGVTFPSPSSGETQAHAIRTMTCANPTLPSEVLLCTAVIKIFDHAGKTHFCRVLLDSCAQSNFITSQLANLLNIPRIAVDIPLNGINKMESRVTQAMRTRIASKNNAFEDELTFLIIPSIGNALPSQFIDKTKLKIPGNIKLADPNFNKPANIDGLIGAELFYKLLCVGQISLEEGSVILQKTRLGWIVSGVPKSSSRTHNTRCHLTVNNELEVDLSKFWEIEEVNEQRILSPEESECEAHYKANTKRDIVTGRYVVRIPFKKSVGDIGESYSIALKRFYALERSLERKPEIKKQYSAFIREYRELSHMSARQTTDKSQTYFLPHHAVLKTTSHTTKLRVVFDASARPLGGVSLNEAMMTGPTIQDDIFALLLRFRRHKYVLTADIAKMYRQIVVHPDDRKYQCILWRENVHDPIEIYELKTVTYGTAAAPFLATRTLKQLADDEEHAYPDAAEILRNDFYVDDLLTGTDNYETARKLRDDLLAITKRGGFELRQWASNDASLLPDATCQTNKLHLCLDTEENTKTLGITWNAKPDNIEYSVLSIEPIDRVTKRSILSQVAKLYDPLGLVGPVIVKAKILMQQLWQEKIDWDESVPPGIFTVWNDYQRQLRNFDSLRFPRRIIVNGAISIQLHGFCDASERAYGACIYLRSINRDGNVISQLACSKSRVAPLKTQTLPRLELCAAQLLIRLYKSTIRALKINIDKSFFWSDSTIALQWINSSPHTLKTFVANRVMEIQEHSRASQWRHVPTKDNPADIISRGLNPKQFLDVQDQWQRGPSWLQLTETCWPHTEIQLREIPEKRATTNLLTAIKESNDLLTRFSTITRAKRIIAYCLRFRDNVRNKDNRRTGHLTVEELQDALRVIIRRTQEETFAQELYALTASKNLPKRSNLLPLAVFVDDQRIIRVGGRLKHADISYDQKHPILLPMHHHITDIIIRETHVGHYHAGAAATLNALRQMYWPLNGRTAVKRIIRNCVTCRRTQPAVERYAMGNLPSNRLQLQRPFLVCGVDYCGPFFIKERRHRNRSKVKIHIAIFVCFATKATHMELVEDLTSEAFLAALKRFFARRGKASDVYSDNGSTFIGAQRELNEIRNFLSDAKQQDNIADRLANEGIKWHFIPPRSPHFGGLWEAAVKAFKKHFKRVIGESVLTYEAMLTCVIEIEGILNSRPLIPISTDPNDLTALTPAHFLIGDTLTSTPEYDLRNLKPARLSTWQHIQQIKQHFWARWYKDYLHELTVRKKWHDSNSANVQIGTLVTMRDENLSPMHWKLARVTKLHPGDDGIIRVVTVQTKDAIYKRSIKSLSPLLLDDN